MYYRSSEQVKELLGDFNKQPKSVKQVRKRIAKRHGMKKLGTLKDMNDDSIVVERRKADKPSTVPFAPKAIGKLFRSGAYEDLRQGMTVIVLGQSKKGVVVDFIAVNRDSLLECMETNA